jgi:lincosamide nucleotidyltransferase A/C/D/E
MFPGLCVVNKVHPTPEMTSVALVGLLQLFEKAGLSVWLDGGWGIDALLRTQTRIHRDVDIILPVTEAPKLQELLALQGFSVREGQPPNSFILADGAGLEVDVHAVTFDDEGNGIYRMQNGEDWIYPAEGFSGRGFVNGIGVQCLSAKSQVLCHAYGYVPTEKDFQDMEHLAKHSNIELPPHLKPSVGSKKS